MSPKEGSKGRKVVGRKTLQIIRASLYILTVISIICGVVAGYLFGVGSVAPLVGATGLLLLLPSALSLCYAFLHTLAARWRREFHFSQKKPKRTGLQSACFIIARFVTALWLTTAVAEIIVAATMPMCVAAKNNRNFWAGGKACALHRLVVAGSVIAFLTSSMLLCALEVSERPFDAHFLGVDGPRRPKFDPSTGPKLSGPFTQEQIVTTLSAEKPHSQHGSPEEQIHQYDYQEYHSVPLHSQGHRYSHPVEYHHEQHQIRLSSAAQSQPQLQAQPIGQERDIERGLAMAGAWPDEEDDIEAGHNGPVAAIKSPPQVHFQQPQPQRQGSTSTTRRVPSWGSAWTSVIAKAGSNTSHAQVASTPLPAPPLPLPTRVTLPQKPQPAHTSPKGTAYTYVYTTANATTQTDPLPQSRPASRTRRADSPVTLVYTTKTSPTSSSTYSSSSSATSATSVSSNEMPFGKGALSGVAAACAACACVKCAAYLAATTRAPSAAGTVVSAATGTTLTNNSTGIPTNVTGSTAVSSSSSSVDEHTRPRSVALEEMKPQYISTSVQAQLPTPPLSLPPTIPVIAVAIPQSPQSQHSQSGNQSQQQQNYQEQHQQHAQHHIQQYSQYRQHQQESHARRYLAAIQHPYAEFTPRSSSSPTPILTTSPPSPITRKNVNLVLNHPLPPTPLSSYSQFLDFESPLPTSLAPGGNTVYRSASSQAQGQTSTSSSGAAASASIPVPVPTPRVLGPRESPPPRTRMPREDHRDQKLFYRTTETFTTPAGHAYSHDYGQVQVPMRKVRQAPLPVPIPIREHVTRKMPGPRPMPGKRSSSAGTATIAGGGGFEGITPAQLNALGISIV